MKKTLIKICSTLLFVSLAVVMFFAVGCNCGTKTKDITYTAPTAKTGLVYTGQAQELFTAGNVEKGGTLQYKLGSGAYGTAVPTATNAGTYTVYYKVDANADYNAVAEKSLTVTIAKAEAVAVTTAPTAKTGLTYTGVAQGLITAGTVGEGGTLQYKLDNGEYSTTLPTATNVGTYTVYYKVVGDTNHKDGTEEQSLTVEIAKAESVTVTTAPTAKTGLTYTGVAQELITAGTVGEGGTLQYKLDSGEYSTALPTATNVGTYTVYYKVVGDTNHKDGTEQSLTIEIAKADNVITAPTQMPAVYCADDLTAITFGFTVLSGTVKLQFSAEESGTYTDTLSVLEGTYYVKATAENVDTNSYNNNAQAVTKSFAVSHKLGVATTVQGASVKHCVGNDYTQVTGTIDKQETSLQVALESEEATVNGGEIDLTAYLTENGTATLTLNNAEYIGTVTGGKVSLLNVPATVYGEQSFTVVITLDKYSINVTVPIFVVTRYIASEADMIAISGIEKALSGSGYYKLTSDITLSDTAIVKGGGSSDTLAIDNSLGNATNGFVGTLDGNGHTVTNLYLSQWETNYYGFIKVLGNGGVLKNIAFLDVTFNNKVSIVARAKSDSTIENVYVKYKKITVDNQNQSSTFSDNWQGEKVTLKNIIVDFNNLTFVNSTLNASLRMFGCFWSASTIENVALLGVQSQYKDNLIVKVVGSSLEQARDLVYIQYSDTMAKGKESIAIPSTGWDETYWAMAEGSLPTPKFSGVTVSSTAGFTASTTAMTAGSTYTFKTNDNCIIALGTDAQDIATIDSVGTVTVVAGATGSFTVYAYNVYDYTNPVLVVVSIAQTLSGSQPVNLNASMSNGSVVASGNITLDLTSVYTDTTTGVSVSVGSTKVTSTGSITSGSLTFDASGVPATNYGSSSFVVTFTDGETTKMYIVPVNIITKSISTVDDLKGIATISNAINYGGYFKLANDITLTVGKSGGSSANWYDTSLQIGKDSGFTGTIDGDSHAIINLQIRNTNYFIGTLTGVLKNINFTNFYLGENGGIVKTGSGTIQDVKVTYARIGDDAWGGVNANHFTNNLTTFGFFNLTNTFTMTNVTVDFTNAVATLTEKVTSWNNANLNLLGKYSNSATLTNVKVTGVPNFLAEYVTNRKADITLETVTV